MPTHNKAKIPVGFVIAGKYRITGELGRGGMAAVYEAENVDIGKRVAIKVLAQELISSAVVVERFLREARAVAAIRSPYICDVYDSGRLEDGRPFLVLELLEGESLYEQMIRVGQIDVPTTVMIVTQTCKGLIKAHAVGIVHRDLKPENIFVTRDEEGRVLAKILDFGLAKFYSSMETGNQGQARLTREGAVFGTPAYMSPEQVRGQGAVDSRADLWALACITYESLTGRTVWNTEQGVAMTFAQIANAPLPDAYALRPDLPDGFKAWFERALDRNIEKRFQTPKEFADELLRAMSMGQLSSAHIETEDLLGGVGREFTLDPPFPTDPRASGTATVPSPAPRSSRAHFAAPGSPAQHGQERGSPGGGPLSSKNDFVTQTDKDVGPSTAKPYGGPSAGRLVFALAIVAGLGVAAFFGYRALVPAAQPTSLATTPKEDAGPPPSASSPSPSASESSSVAPLTGLPFRPLVSKAQEKITTGDYAGAIKDLKEALAMGQHGLPQTMLQDLEQAAIGAKQNAACRLTGLGRPRIYDLLEDKVKIIAANQPAIAVGPGGPIVTWTENRDGNEQAYAVGLDDAMRSRNVPFAVTPEQQVVGNPTLYPAGDRFIITYWDSRGSEAGVFARFLDGDGRIATDKVLIAKAAGLAAWPTLFTLPPGSSPGGSQSDARYAIAWIAPTERNTDDLFVRFVSRDLEPDGDAIRVTALQPGVISKAKVRFPVSAVDGSAAHFAIRLERDPNRLIEHIRVPFGELGKGVETKDLTPKSPDASIGEMALINVDKGRGDQPSIACNASACYIAWGDEQREGVWDAFIENGKSGPTSRTPFAKRGRRPSLAVASNGSVRAFWYEASRLMTASIDRDGAHGASPIAHVTGDHPPPSVAPGKKPGEWYVAWQDYEGGHFEIYVARAECK